MRFSIQPVCDNNNVSIVMAKLILISEGSGFKSINVTQQASFCLIIPSHSIVNRVPVSNVEGGQNVQYCSYI